MSYLPHSVSFCAAVFNCRRAVALQGGGGGGGDRVGQLSSSLAAKAVMAFLKNPMSRKESDVDPYASRCPPTSIAWLYAGCKYSASS